MFSFTIWSVQQPYGNQGTNESEHTNKIRKLAELYLQSAEKAQGGTLVPKYSTAIRAVIKHTVSIIGRDGPEGIRSLDQSRVR